MKNQFPDYINLLFELIKTPSVSGNEAQTAELLSAFLKKNGIEVERKHNNIWVRNRHFDEHKPTILLNSHHDTVKPSQDYSFDPYSPKVSDGKLYGLGSNDAGGPLITLIEVFRKFYDQQNMSHNLLLLLSAEEEISGQKGIASVIGELNPIQFAIVGEPTNSDIAIAEKGLMVLDCTASGKSGHAALGNGVNAIYQSISCINWFKDYKFPKKSEILGPIHMNVTMIDSGTQHNVIPDRCHFVVDVRTTDAYSNQETLKHIQEKLPCQVTARSTRLQPSFFDPKHSIIKKGIDLGCTTYGSPTISDQSLIPVPSFKMGPGQSTRSHIADEFIELEDIDRCIDRLKKMLDEVIH